MAAFNDRHEHILGFIIKYTYIDREQLLNRFLPHLGGGGTSEPTLAKVMNPLLEADYIRKQTFARNGTRKMYVLYYITLVTYVYLQVLVISNAS